MVFLEPIIAILMNVNEVFGNSKRKKQNFSLIIISNFEPTKFERNNSTNRNKSLFLKTKVKNAKCVLKYIYLNYTFIFLILRMSRNLGGGN